MIANIHSFNNGVGFYSGRQLEVIITRKSILDRFESSDLSLTKFAKANGLSPSTLCRHRKKAERGMEGLVDYRREGKTIRKSHVSNEIISFVLAHQAAHPKTSKQNVYRALVEQASKEGWKIPSYPHLCRIIRKMPNDVKTMLSESARKNWEKWGLCARRESEFPNALWQMDASELDVWVLDTTTGELFKPWMTAAIDTYSRVVMAVLIHRKEPTSADSLRTLLNAAMPKNREDCPFFGLPQRIQRDNHQIYKSVDFIDTLLRLGINLGDIPNHCPSANGKIERFFQTFQMQFLVELNGYANQHNGLALAKKNAIPFPMMQKLAEKFLLRYHLRNHAGIKGLSPWEQWHENLSEAHGLVFNASEIHENFKIRKEVTLKRDGIELEPGRHFSDPELAGYVGEKLILRLPLDERPEEVEAYLNGAKVGTLRCVEENPSLADQINVAQLNRTIELQRFRKQMREAAPVPEYEEEAKGEIEKLEVRKSSKAQEASGKKMKSSSDSTPDTRTLSSPMKNGKNGKCEQMLLNIPELKMEDEK